MSRVSLLVHVGGTAMLVDFEDHYSTNNTVYGTCRTCGALVSDYETHLVWHIEAVKDFSLVLPSKAAGND